MLYAIVILKISKVQGFNIIQWSSDKLVKHWLLLSVTRSRQNFLWLSSRCRLIDASRHAENFSVQFIYPVLWIKKNQTFKPKVIAFTATQRHASLLQLFHRHLIAAFSTLWISIQITHNGNGNFKEWGKRILNLHPLLKNK